MVRYWCFTCSCWRGPWAADECATHDHHVVSEKQKIEMDEVCKVQKEVLEQYLAKTGEARKA